MNNIKTKSLLTFALLLTLNTFSTQAAETVFYVHTDHLGSPIAYTDVNGNVIGREYYTPYGESLNPPTTDDTVSYTGHVRDGDTGLLYMQARYYDPEIGRFLSVDPVTFSPSNPDHFNRYWYANGNPYMYTDPDGRNGTFALAVPKPFPAPPPVLAVVAVGVSAYTAGTWFYESNATEFQDGLEAMFNESADEPSSDEKGKRAGKDNEPRSDLPRDKGGNYQPHPDAEGPHTTLGTRIGSDGDSYTQGATFDEDGTFTGRTDVTDHGRGDHESPHFHPATGPNSVGPAEAIPEIK